MMMVNHTLKHYSQKPNKENEYKQFTKGTIIRSRVKWYGEGETNSKYFMGLEKHNNVKNSIVELKSKKGKRLTAIDELLNETLEYCEKLYTSNNININSINSYVNNTETSQQDDDYILCEGPLTVDECTYVVKKFKDNRSPGCDELTPEFYTSFWNDIKHLVIDSLNEGLSTGEMFFTQRRGIIELLHEKGDKDNLNN